MNRASALLGLALLLFACAPAVQAYSSPGTPVGQVNDFAGVLSAPARQTLESELVAFEQSTSNEIAVAIVPNMGGDYIENYAVKLFEEWGIGKEKQDNGVLLLLAIDERQMRIEVGYGLEGALPDSLAQRILDNEMTPRLVAGDYDGAVTAGVRAIEAATKGEYQPGKKDSSWPEIILVGTAMLAILFIWLFQKGFVFVIFGIVLASMLGQSKSWWLGGVVGAVAGVALAFNGMFGSSVVTGGVMTIALILFGLVADFFLSRSYTKAKQDGKSPWWVPSAGTRRGVGSGGSHGGGFGGFGGGSSGGGGASGRW